MKRVPPLTAGFLAAAALVGCAVSNQSSLERLNGFQDIKPANTNAVAKKDAPENKGFSLNIPLPVFEAFAHGMHTLHKLNPF